MKYAERVIRNLEIQQLKKTGLSNKFIASLYGFSPSYISMLKKKQFKCKERCGFNPSMKSTYLEIARLRKGGLTLNAVGKQFGLTRERVRQICLVVSRKDWEVGREHNAKLIEKLLGTCLDATVLLIPHCLICSKPKVSRNLCADCLKRRNVISQIASRLRSRRIVLAAYLIRKHRVSSKEFHRFFTIRKTSNNEKGK